jgi:hypothetical protein
MTQGSRARRGAVVALAALAALACGGHSVVLPPSSPEAVVRSFLNAVQANSLSTMSELWGSDRGPAKSYMNRIELEQRLTIIRSFLRHDKFAILDAPGGIVGADGRRSLQVRLVRKGCEPVVPFTVMPYGGGWLISDIDLSKAGNPQRSCTPPSPDASTRLPEPATGSRRLLGELEEDTRRRLGVQERYAVTPCAGPRPLIHQPEPMGAALSERLVEIRHLEADVMDARTAAFEEPADRAVRLLGHQQLDLGLAHRQRNDARAVGRLRRFGLDAQHVAVEGEGLGQVGDGNSDVADDGSPGHGSRT